MNTVNFCERCGSEIIDDESPTLHKCLKCKNIRFSREILSPLEGKIKRNFQKIKKSTYGNFLTGLYQFGSFPEGKTECGDIDFLITFDEAKHGEIINSEIELFHLRYEMLSDGGDSVFELKSCLVKGFWDFNTCSEYPDCLDCFHTSRCHLPDEDYTSSIHNYCTTKCEKKRKIRFPECCYSGCDFLYREIKNRIAKDIRELLTEGGIDFISITSHQEIKVIDIMMKNSVDTLIEEFNSMKIKKNLKIVRIF